VKFLLDHDVPAEIAHLIGGLGEMSRLAGGRLDYDASPAATGCQAPIAYIASYIGTVTSIADLTRFRSLAPHRLTGHTLGSGHFSPLFVPDQINAMLSAFAEARRFGRAGEAG
jgi:hypothetical protein